MLKTAHILNGKEIAAKRFEKLSKELSEIRRSGAELGLTTIQVGQAQNTTLYAKAIRNLLGKLQILHNALNFPQAIQEKELRGEIFKINKDPHATGIMIFAPLPRHIALESVLRAVDVLKDVEGRRMSLSSKSKVMPPTAMAAVALFEETGIDATGKEALVIGRSDVVGKPVALLMLEKNATVTIAHSKTVDLKQHVERADIVIAAVGKPGLVKGEWVKPGAVVIDVGENVVKGQLIGDVEFEKAKELEPFISPVPGGGGPVTNLMMIQNLISLYKLQALHHGNP